MPKIVKNREPKVNPVLPIVWFLKPCSFYSSMGKEGNKPEQVRPKNKVNSKFQSLFMQRKIPSMMQEGREKRAG